MCITKFGKRNPLNISITFCNNLGIHIKSFPNFRLFKNHVIHKICPLVQ